MKHYIEIPDEFIESPELKPNFRWYFGGNKSFYFEFYTPKTLFNQVKWWLGTKTFIPGTYEWTRKDVY